MSTLTTATPIVLPPPFEARSPLHYYLTPLRPSLNQKNHATDWTRRETLMLQPHVPVSTMVFQLIPDKQFQPLVQKKSKHFVLALLLLMGIAKYHYTEKIRAIALS